jgi:hypothetical protein
MPVPVTLEALKTQLETTLVVPTTPIVWPTPAIYADPQSAISGANMPSLMLALAPNVDHYWRTQTNASGLARHDYLVAVYLSVALMTMKLNERHARVLGWPEAIQRSLAQNRTLSGQVAFIGNKEYVWSYRIQPTQWADGTYWGLKGIIPVTEKQTMTMG